MLDKGFFSKTSLIIIFLAGISLLSSCLNREEPSATAASPIAGETKDNDNPVEQYPAEYTVYKALLLDILPDYNTAADVGALIDLNGDGTEELLLHYWGKGDVIICQIWSVIDGEARLFVECGSLPPPYEPDYYFYSGGFSTVMFESEQYICFWNRCADFEEYICDETYTLYSMIENELVIAEDFRFEFEYESYENSIPVPNDAKDGSYERNGVSITKDEFIAVRESFTNPYENLLETPDFFYGSRNGELLTDILRRLQPIDTAAYPAYYEAAFGGVFSIDCIGRVFREFGDPERVEEIENIKIGNQTAELIYYYPDAEFYVRENHWGILYLCGITVKERTDADSLRRIKVGDRFNEVLHKFPNERDYLADENGFFYLGDENYNGVIPSGAVLENPEGGKIIEIIVENGECLEFYFDADDILTHYRIFKKDTYLDEDLGYNAPLQLGENILGKVSVDEITEKFGDYLAYETAYYPGNGCCYIRLIYDKMIVSLEFGRYRSDIPLSFNPDNGDDGFGFGDRNHILTENDKKIKGICDYVIWCDTLREGPRQIKPGDSLDAVKAKFLDMYDIYGNGETIYGIEDVHPGWPEPVYTPGGAVCVSFLMPDEPYLTSEKDLAYFKAKPDTVLEYYAYYPPEKNPDGSLYVDYYQYTWFYFQNDVLIAIQQGITPNTP